MPTEPTASDAERAAEIEARLKAATPGPWYVDGSCNDEILVRYGASDDEDDVEDDPNLGHVIAAFVDLSFDAASANADFVAAARDDIAWLLADRAALAKRAEEMTESYRRLATEHAQMEDTLMAIGDVLGDAEFLDRSTADAKARIEALMRDAARKEKLLRLIVAETDKQELLTETEAVTRFHARAALSAPAEEPWVCPTCKGTNDGFMSCCNIEYRHAQPAPAEEPR